MRSRRISTHRSELLASRAGEMKHSPTRSEAALWRWLSGRKLGESFKRQVPVDGRYIVDFLAARCRLVVEVDGAYHTRRSAADGRRDRALERLGYRVLRLSDELVLRQWPEALRLVREALNEGR